MKTVLLLLSLFLVVLAIEAQKKRKWNEKFSDLKHSLKKKHLDHKLKKEHFRERQHKKFLMILAVCKDLKCQDGEGCKILRNGSAACVRCMNCREAPLHPICGSDGRQYNSVCHFRRETCLQNKIGLIRIQCDSPCQDCPGDEEFEAKKEEQGLLNKDSPSDEKESFLKKEMENMTKKWKNWVQTLKKDKPKDNCSGLINITMAERLMDWFHILRADHLRAEMEEKGIQNPNFVFREMKPQEAKAPFPSGFEHKSCRDPINSMFDFLDEDKNDILEDFEIEEVKNIPYEHCIGKFFDACDQGQDGMFSRMEFCDCFPVVPPCLRQRRLRTFLVKDETKKLPGMYIPSCDEDGFFMPQQCVDLDGSQKCWCVDRNGGKIEGSTGNCADNTKAMEEDTEQEDREE